MSKDINDHIAAGTLPEDPTTLAKPVSAEAKRVAEDEGRLMTVEGILKASWDEATAPESKRRILTTCHWEIDRDTGGFCDEDVWVIAGKSSWGKTSFTIACADENIQRGARVLIVSGEDRPSLYGTRLMIRRTQIDRYRYATRRMNSDEFNRGVNVLSQAERIPVYLDARGKSVEWAAKRVKQIVAQEGIDLIFWDYLQCFDKEKHTQDQRLAMTYMARVMTDTIKTTGKAGAILSQVTPDEKANVPDMYSVRDSKDVANAAEVVAIGFFSKTSIERDVDGQKTMIANEGERVIVLAKNKPGPGPMGRIYRMGTNIGGFFETVPNPNDETDRYIDSLTGPMSSPYWNEQAER
jgi:replicative DNA helicase